MAAKVVTDRLGENGPDRQLGASTMRVLPIAEDLVIAVCSRVFSRKRYRSCFIDCWRAYSRNIRCTVGTFCPSFDKIPLSRLAALIFAASSRFTDPMLLIRFVLTTSSCWL